LASHGTRQRHNRWRTGSDEEGAGRPRSGIRRQEQASDGDTEVRARRQEGQAERPTSGRTDGDAAMAQRSIRDRKTGELEEKGTDRGATEGRIGREAVCGGLRRWREAHLLALA
jgi:hypothetical protein